MELIPCRDDVELADVVGLDVDGPAAAAKEIELAIETQEDL